jgi:hypothetical protein
MIIVPNSMVAIAFFTPVASAMTTSPAAVTAIALAAVVPSAMITSTAAVSAIALLAPVVSAMSELPAAVAAIPLLTLLAASAMRTSPAEMMVFDLAGTLGLLSVGPFFEVVRLLFRVDDIPSAMITSPAAVSAIALLAPVISAMSKSSAAMAAIALHVLLAASAMSTSPAAMTVFDSTGTFASLLAGSFFVVVGLALCVDNILLEEVKNCVLLVIFGGVEASVEICRIFEAVKTHIHRRFDT